MKRLKTFAKYIICIILFYIFSHVMIFIGLNNNYKNINLEGTIPEGISIKLAQATSVNGKIEGTVSEELNYKYIKFNFYNNVGSLSDSYYVNISELNDGNFEFYFKLNYIKSYGIELSNEAPITTSSENFSLEEYKNTILLSALVTLLFI